MKVATWLRVSTDEQTTENQRLALTQHAKTAGLEIVYEFNLEGVSGWQSKAKIDAEITRVINLAAAYHYEGLLIWSIDRLSRLGTLSTFQIIQRLKDNGIRVISAQESGLDTGTTMGELMLGVISTLAKMESERRSERIKAGMRRARKEGKHVGRPRRKKS